MLSPTLTIRPSVSLFSPKIDGSTALRGREAVRLDPLHPDILYGVQYSYTWAEYEYNLISVPSYEY